MRARLAQPAGRRPVQPAVEPAVLRTVLLTMRRHIDLVRVSGAGC